ncbi:hypothetical protein [uncultured Rikenella sp.]|uniref:hypothetical protein n=1 Tax=uncultured Rikenella sp. TaxID=368003 RepID=UPI00262DA160|nr:hypothetical protein [uncultured Rikenella sp.]
MSAFPLSAFPAPGYRYYRTGVPGDIGNYGYNSASAVSSTYGTYLGFYVAWLNPSGADHRGYGFQLRCLSE